ncbi:methionyl-tRNA formyltransferase [Clostridium guangxiense]|nr:methionyl-tRNA formyltransferase [Clostridium guangxiense]
MGTPEFAVPSLKKLIENYDVKAVFTQPDRPKGRGKKLAMSPVKEIALECNIPVFQPVSLKKEPEYVEKLKEIKPDFIVVVAFGQILSEEVLNIPKYACINVHASLLPKYRGSAPIIWSIVNGEKKSGVTTMLMAKGIDTGDMLLKCETDIDFDMTAGQLHDILSEKGAQLLLNTIEDFKDGKIAPQKQNDEEASYISVISKDLGEINWNNDAVKIHNLIRGLNPWPSAYTHYKDKVMKIHKTKVIDSDFEGTPGLITDVSKDGIKIETTKGKLLVTSIQFPGKKIMSVKDYIAGNTIEKGTILK